MNDKEREKIALCTAETFFHFFFFFPFSICTAIDSWKCLLHVGKCFVAPRPNRRLCIVKRQKYMGINEEVIQRYSWLFPSICLSAISLPSITTCCLYLIFALAPLRASHTWLNHDKPQKSGSDSKTLRTLDNTEWFISCCWFAGKIPKVSNWSWGEKPVCPQNFHQICPKLDKLCNVRRQRDRGEYQPLLLSCYLLSFNLSNLHLRMFLAANLHNLHKVYRRDVTVGNSAEIERDEWNGYSQLIRVRGKYKRRRR